MRSILPALLSAIVIAALSAVPAAADRASGLATGKRQHKPLIVTKNWSSHRAHVRRLKKPEQRRAALKLVEALEQAKRRQARAFDRRHRLKRSRKSRSVQRNQTDTEFLRGRARRQGKGGGDVAMEELTLAHEGMVRVRSSYDDLRRTLGTRTDCVRKCDGAKRRCDSRCRTRGGCACVVTASDCLLSELQARRCSSTGFTRGWPSKWSGPSPKSDGR